MRTDDGNMALSEAHALMLWEKCRVQLHTMAEPEYRRFSASLLPGTEGILGVRLPALRGIAAQMMREGEGEGWLSAYFAAQDSCFEEDMLAGFFIAGLRILPEERLRQIRHFLPCVNNWSVCDSFCGSLKEAARLREYYWPLVQECLSSGKEFTVRVGLVLLLDHFRTPEWMDRALEAICTADLPGYYAEMAAGWALSLFYLDSREKVRPLLDKGKLSEEVRRIALRKICESRRCLPEERRQFAVDRGKKR